MVLEHETNWIVGEADSEQSGDVGVVQTGHYACFALKIRSGHNTRFPDLFIHAKPQIQLVAYKIYHAAAKDTAD